MYRFLPLAVARCILVNKLLYLAVHHSDSTINSFTVAEIRRRYGEGCTYDGFLNHRNLLMIVRSGWSFVDSDIATEYARRLPCIMLMISGRRDSIGLLNPETRYTRNQGRIREALMALEKDYAMLSHRKIQARV